MRGSAPRVRGTDHRRGQSERIGRFSPARAGNGRCRAAHSWCSAVQPRACGERDATPVSNVSSAGSAPRVRGTGPPSKSKSRKPRFSPARAGNGLRDERWLNARPVQPRACGERMRCGSWKKATTGSAPRVRGTAHRCSPRGADIRFSPARAGNGLCPFGVIVSGAVQPRACGERTDAICSRRQ